MKTMTWCALVLITGTVCQGLAADEGSVSGKWYGRLDMGGNFSNGAELTLYDGPVTGGSEMELSAGAQFDMALGYRLLPWLLVEGELGFSFNGVDAVGNWSYPDSSLTQMSFMANVVFERPLGRWVPYAGFGAGGVFSSLAFGNYNYYYYGSSDGYGTDVVPALQAFAGLRYKVSQNFSLGVDYRYLVTDDQQWNVDWWTGNEFTVGVNSVAIHSIALVFSVSF